MASFHDTVISFCEETSLLILNKKLTNKIVGKNLPLSGNVPFTKVKERNFSFIE